MFNIGLELSIERLSSMKKYVFGLGSAQVLVTAVVVGLVSRFIAGSCYNCHWERPGIIFHYCCPSGIAGMR
ncbi:hypothetical protein ACSBR1_017006 [Camellia fascicularis]